MAGDGRGRHILRCSNLKSERDFKLAPQAATVAALEVRRSRRTAAPCRAAQAAAAAAAARVEASMEGETRNPP